VAADTEVEAVRVDPADIEAVDIEVAADTEVEAVRVDPAGMEVEAVDIEVAADTEVEAVRVDPAGMEVEAVDIEVATDTEVEAVRVVGVADIRVRVEMLVLRADQSALFIFVQNTAFSFFTVSSRLFSIVTFYCFISTRRG